MLPAGAGEKVGKGWGNFVDVAAVDAKKAHATNAIEAADGKRRNGYLARTKRCLFSCCFHCVRCVSCVNFVRCVGCKLQIGCIASRPRFFHYQGIRGVTARH